MKKIKIYNYEAENCFYIGWEWYQQIIGAGLPANSTDIEPPTYTKGFIPVFNGSNWIVVKDHFWRPEYEEVTYYSGRSNETYSPICLSLLSGDFPIYPCLSQVCNSQLVSFLIIQKVRNVQEKYRELCSIFNDFNNQEWLISIPLDGPKDYIGKFSEQTHRLYKYHFIAEEMVANIRSSIDYLIQLTFMLTNYTDYMKNRTVETDSIGKLLRQSNNKKLPKDLRDILIGDGVIYDSDSTDYFKHINDISNSIKHSMMHSEAVQRLPIDRPTVISLQATNNNHDNKIIYHNHCACQLVIGFQNTMKRILKNQKKYINHKSE